jgi:hypothetical protein
MVPRFSGGMDLIPRKRSLSSRNGRMSIICFISALSSPLGFRRERSCLKARIDTVTGGSPFSAFPFFTSHFERFKSQFEDLKRGYLQRLQIKNESLLSLTPFILTGDPARISVLNLSA